MPHTLKHVLPVTAGVNGRNHLEIGGCDAGDLAAEFGTPLFVFCEETFRQRSREFRKAFPESSVYYAAKAFSSLAVCALAEQEGLGMDVASGGELHMALSAGFPPERLILHGNNKLDSDIASAAGAGVGRIAVDNIDEIGRVQAAASLHGRRQAVLVRVTPGVEAHTHHYVQTGQEDSKFGLPLESEMASEALRSVASSPDLELAGIHAHIGSNIFSFDPYAKTIEILFEFIGRMEREGIAIREVNLGGGIGVPYVAGDYPARLDLLADMVRETADREASRHGIAVPELAFEPGRFLVANAVVTLYTVGVIKEVPGLRTYVSVDGGMSDNIRPALYQARYAALLANKARQEPGRVVTVAGMHCESGDVLIRDVALPSSIERGDILAIPATGAYGYAMASNYNKMPRPPVVLVRDGRSEVVVRRETYDDLIRLDRG
ncbi:MAG: diaminopimelate decarboxylase [Actinomycetota bacterium]